VHIEDFISGLPYTFHNYGQKKDFIKIDYVYASEEIKCKQIGIWSDCRNQVYLSDHYPVCTDMDLIGGLS